MWAKGLRLSKNQFVQMLKNPEYASLIYIRENDGEPECFVKGKHEAIVTEELFAKVQERMRRLSREGENSPSVTILSTT
jgi:site-specific DNA recombinase